MESKVSLQCSQGPTTGPCPEPDASSAHLPPYFPEIHSAIYLHIFGLKNLLEFPGHGVLGCDTM
jgi:hypothetical protein